MTSRMDECILCAKRNNFPLPFGRRRVVSRDRLVVRTLRCGRSNPGSNPGPGNFFFKSPVI